MYILHFIFYCYLPCFHFVFVHMITCASMLLIRIHINNIALFECKRAVAGMPC